MRNKDFYEKLPSFVCEILDSLEEDFGKEDWFDVAWDKYEKHVLETKDREDIKMPGWVFKEYIKSE